MTAIEFIKLQVADWLDDHPGKAMGRHHAWLVETWIDMPNDGKIVGTYMLI